MATPAALLHEKHCVDWNWQKKLTEKAKTSTSCRPFITAEVTAPTFSSILKKARHVTSCTEGADGQSSTKQRQRQRGAG